MRFDGFLRDLLEEGRVRVAPPDVLTDAERRAARQVLVEFERSYRRQLPGTPPALDFPAAAWAAERMLRACQFAVFRDLPAEAIAQEAAQRFEGPASPVAHYSVDLLFRVLPDLLRLARRAAERDPLVEHLLGWASAWPLSSVGVELSDELARETFLEDDCLRRLYVDRILAADDPSRLGDPRVAAGLRAAVGEQIEMPPKLARALASPGETVSSTAAKNEPLHDEETG